MKAEELAEHVLNISESTEETLASKNSRLRRGPRGLFQGTRKEVFHGFVVVPQSMCEEDVEAFSKIHEKELPALFASAKHGAAAAYGAVFSPILLLSRGDLGQALQAVGVASLPLLQ